MGRPRAVDVLPDVESVEPQTSPSSVDKAVPCPLSPRKRMLKPYNNVGVVRQLKSLRSADDHKNFNHVNIVKHLSLSKGRVPKPPSARYPKKSTIQPLMLGVKSKPHPTLALEFLVNRDGAKKILLVELTDVEETTTVEDVCELLLSGDTYHYFRSVKYEQLARVVDQLLMCFECVQAYRRATSLPKISAFPPRRPVQKLISPRLARKRKNKKRSPLKPLAATSENNLNAGNTITKGFQKILITKLLF